jgi:ferredoxin
VADAPAHRVTVHARGSIRVLTVLNGANLRRALIRAGLSPYAALTRRANCGGRGLCATCGVRLLENAPPPAHWHDALAARFGYPRLSCQIAVTGDLTVMLVDDKRVWGAREPQSR